MALLAVELQQTAREDLVRGDGARKISSAARDRIPSDVACRATGAIRREPSQRADQDFVERTAPEAALESRKRLASYADRPFSATAEEALAQVTGIVDGLTVNIPVLVAFLSELAIVGYNPVALKTARERIHGAIAEAEQNQPEEQQQRHGILQQTPTTSRGVRGGRNARANRCEVKPRCACGGERAAGDSSSLRAGPVGNFSYWPRRYGT